MSNLPLPPVPPTTPVTVDGMETPPADHVVSGLRVFRKDMTKIFERAYNGEEIEIVEMGFDRQEKAKYKLIKI